MIQKIEKILMQYANHEIWFNEAHNKLCNLHNVMLKDRNRWRLLAWFLICVKAIEVILKYTNYAQRFGYEPF